MDDRLTLRLPIIGACGVVAYQLLCGFPSSAAKNSDWVNLVLSVCLGLDQEGLEFLYSQLQRAGLLTETNEVILLDDSQLDDALYDDYGKKLQEVFDVTLMGNRTRTPPEKENKSEPQTNFKSGSSVINNSTPPSLSPTISSLQSKDFIKNKEAKDRKNEVNSPPVRRHRPLRGQSPPPQIMTKSEEEILVEIVNMLFDAWSEFSSLRQSQKDGKVYDRSLKSVAYSLEGYSEEQLREAVITYGQIMCHPSRMLTRKWGIDQFLVPEVFTRFLPEKNPWWQYARIQKSSTQIDKDSDPEFTQYIADRYAKLVQGKKGFELKAPSKEYMHFTSVAERARGFVETTKVKALKDPKQVVKYLIEGLLWYWQGGENQKPKEIFPGNLSSNHAWETVLPAYLKENFPDMEHEFDYSRFEGE